VRDDAARRGAALSSRADRAEQDRPRREVEVGVLGHHDRVVTAQLQDAAAERCATCDATRRPIWSIL